MPRIRDRRVALAFAQDLFGRWPGFKPTRTLYLDFEGTGRDERALSLYWPQKAGDDRFTVLWRALDDRKLDKQGLSNSLAELECDPAVLQWVCVFSVGEGVPDEQERFESVFGSREFPSAAWVNLHEAVAKCLPMRNAIKETGWARHLRDRKQVRLSLENLEYEFGLVRPVGLRSHSNRYSDGETGGMYILDFEQSIMNGSAAPDDIGSFADYCLWDVESMFKIARRCEKLLSDNREGGS